MANWFNFSGADGAWPAALIMLADAGLKGFLLLALAGALALALRRASAATRHLVWVLALAGVLALPLASVCLPGWRLPLLPAAIGESDGATAAVAADPAMPPAAPRSVEPAGPPLSGLSHAEAPAASVSAAGKTASPPASASVLAPPSPRQSVLAPFLGSPGFALLALWAAGALLFLAPVLIGAAVVAWMRRRKAERPGEALVGEVRGVGRVLGVHQDVDILLGGPSAMPMAAGLWRPAVFLPHRVKTWPAPKRRAAMLHELAHIRRRDCLTQALARVAAAFHWPNPLVWVALRRLRIERERACDDLVLEAGERPSDYAGHLLEIARETRVGALASAAAITMAGRSRIQDRLRDVLDPVRRRGGVKRRAAIAGGLCAVVVVALLAMVEAGREEVEDASTGNSYEVVFDSGVRAQWVGVGENTKDPNRQAWLPDGTPLTRAPEGFEKSRAHLSPSPGMVVREFYLRLDSLPEGDDVNVTWRVNGASASGWTGAGANGILLGAVGQVPDSDAHAVLEVGVSAGPWRTIAEGSPGSGIGGADDRPSIAFGKPYISAKNRGAGPGGLAVVASHNARKGDYRLVAVDSEGRSHASGSGSSVGFDTFTQSTFHFPALANPEDISRLEFQVRDYEWRKIGDVRVNPDPEKPAVEPAEAAPGIADAPSARSNSMVSTPSFAIYRVLSKINLTDPEAVRPVWHTLMGKDDRGW